MPNARAAVAVAAYRRRRPETEPLYQMLAEHLETFLGLPVGLGRYKPPKFAFPGNPIPPIDEPRSAATACPPKPAFLHPVRNVPGPSGPKWR